jgi:hypothetical protein
MNLCEACKILQRDVGPFIHGRAPYFVRSFIVHPDQPWKLGLSSPYDGRLYWYNRKGEFVKQAEIGMSELMNDKWEVEQPEDKLKEKEVGKQTDTPSLGR